MATLNVGDGAFDFQLYSRPVDFEPAGTIQYIWFDRRAVRSRNSPNLRACIDHWWACMEACHAVEGDTADRQARRDDEVNLVLAELYPLVCTSHGQQRVFRDSFLRSGRSHHDRGESDGNRTSFDSIPDGDGDAYVLDAAATERIRRIVAQRDSSLVVAEIEDVLLGELPLPEEQPALDEMLRRWMTNGVVALRRDGREGLHDYLTNELMPEITRLRRRGRLPRETLFLDMVIYEAKAAFYRCYVNVWSSLIPWLQEHRDLDSLTEQFLRLWHHQQPFEVFRGQVLALHPISGPLMRAAHHQAAIGRYLEAHESCVPPETIEEADWGFVGTILIACREYQHNRDLYEQLRGHSELTLTDQTTAEGVDDPAQSIALQFEDYAATRQITCVSCDSAELRYRTHELCGDQEREMVRIVYRCQSCGSDRSLELTQDDLQS